MPGVLISPVRSSLFEYVYVSAGDIVGGLLIVGDTGKGPAVKPFGSFGWKVDTSVTACFSEIVMPVSAVESNSAFGNVYDPGYSWQVIAIIS